MNLKKGFLCALLFLSLLGTPMSVSWSAGDQDSIQHQDQVSGQSILSPEDLEIIQDLDFWENLSLLDQDDFSVIEESDFAVDQQ